MPELALAIAVKGRWNPSRLAHALEQAGAFQSFIEVHLASDHMPPDVDNRITVHSRPAHSLFQLWGVAIVKSEAPYVAILHAEAPPGPGWIAAMLGALDESDAMCGPVEPAYPPSDRRITGYLVEYCQFHRPIKRGLTEIPGNNLVLRRSEFPAETVMLQHGFSKTSMLATGGLEPAWIAEAVVFHDRSFSLMRFCFRRFQHGRSYAAGRLSRRRTGYRLLLTLVTPILPLVRVGRIVRHAWRHRSLRLAALRRLPAMLLTESFWSAGELVGYITARPGDPALLD